MSPSTRFCHPQTPDPALRAASRALSDLPTDLSAALSRLQAWVIHGAQDPAIPTDSPRDPALLPTWFETRRDPSDRARGAVGTPPGLARALAIAGRVEAVCETGGLVVDPTCGPGALLVAAAVRLTDGLPTPAARAHRLRTHLRGVDLDGDALAVAEAALRCVVGDDQADLTGVLARADLFAGAPPTAAVLLHNPPWVTSAQHQAADPEGRAVLRARFPACRGNWDLCVPATLAALDALPADGRAALLLPRRVLGAPFARGLRAALVARGVSALELPEAPWDAAVDALVVHLDPSTPRLAHLPADGGPWQAEPIPPGWARLDTLAEVCDAATVAEAYAWKPLLRSHAGTPPPAAVRVVNTGTIDPWRALWATRPLRYLGRTIDHPVLDLDQLPPRRAAQARQPKLLLAGLVRSLEVLPDREGTWAGLKSTTLVLPHDEPSWVRLTAWLGSRTGRADADRRLAPTALRGDWLRPSPAAVRELPVPPLPVDTLRPLVDRVLADPDGPARHELDALVDAAVTRG